MQNYTPSTSTYSDTIRVVETTDAVSDTNANAAVKQLIENDIVLKESIDVLIQNGSRLTDVTGASASTTPAIESVSLLWTDPTDVIVDGAVIAEWDRTVVVRKTGSAPANIDDGTQVLSSTVRNAFSESAFVDSTVHFGTTYYYRFFVVSKAGAITAGTALNITPALEKLAVPSPNASITYNGTAQTMTFDNYDATKMSVEGNSATNAGSHDAVFTLEDGYAWTDNTADPKTVSWNIAKAAGSCTLSGNSVELGPDTLSDTVTVSDATGAISGVSSSDNTIATASLSGDTITISSVNDTTGTATITVSIAASANYEATTATISVDSKFTTVYGAEWDGTSTTAWSRTDGAAGFTDPVPYVSGASNYGSPFDTLQPWAGMTTEERAGGTMVKIPKFWYKITQTGSALKVQIADGELDGFSVSPAHMDRGDGEGERDVVYVGRYHCGSTACKSVTGQSPKANITRSSARTTIHNLGSNIWQMDFATRFTIWLLYIVEFADWNSQAKIGYGCGNNSSAQSMGYTDSMPYHTGTTQSSRTTYGLGTQYRNIEGLWDNVYDWCDGCYYNNNGLNIILNPSNFSDSTGGTAIGTPSSGYPSAFDLKDISGVFPMFIPSAANGDENTYSCDYWSFSASSPCLFVGGNYDQGGNHGLFFVSYTGTSYSGAYLGCRLLELP